MIINDPNGTPARVTDDNRIKAVSVIQTDLNALADLGKAWSLPFTVAAADTTDNVVFHFENTSSEDFDFMRLLLSASSAGLWTLEYGRTYSSGGTPIALRQMNVLSGTTQNMSAFFGADLVLAGTATDLSYFRISADVVVDVLEYGPIIIPPSGMIAIRFQADAGTPTMAVTPFIHGQEPW